MSVRVGLFWLRKAWTKTGVTPAFGRFVRENGSGIAGSLLLHALIALLILFTWLRSSTHLPPSVARIVPVEVVRLGTETVAPPAPVKSAEPQQRTAHIPVRQSTSPKPFVGVSPHKTAPPVDEVEAKLRGLARLREPDVPLHALDNNATADLDATTDGAVPGDEATYSLRDYIRAQVERRWSLDIAALGNRNPAILLHVEITRNGTVTKSEIVDQARFKTDAEFRNIAISARNAVLLSSPFALPPGNYQDVMDMTLSLSPRDAIR
ncbi:MAG TPA: hypothetical protein VMF67_05005 [Rhizomicrobium sp.]|nr:hypothetical protein [Rhizomicrobium sp.]